MAEAKTVGHVVLRMADATVLPLQFTDFAATMGESYVAQLRKLADDKRSSTAELDKLLEQRAFELNADPTRMVRPPEREAPVPQVNLTPLDAVVTRLKASAQAYDAAYAGASTPVSSSSMRASARRSTRSCRAWSNGSRTRAACRGANGSSTSIYAPGVLTGYGVKTMPGVREAMEADHWSEADEYAAITAQVLGKYCDGIERATALLNGAGH